MYNNYRKTVFPYTNKDGSTVWVVEFPDLPGCSAVGNTEEEALAESKVASELWLDEYFEENKCYPVPKEISNSFSGRLLVRMPKTLHKELAAEAEEEGVSLNSLVVALLAQNYGRKMTKPTFNITFSATPAVEKERLPVDYEEQGKTNITNIYAS